MREKSPIYLPMVRREGRNPSGVLKTLNERERTEKEKIVVDLRRKKLMKVLISCRDGRLPVVASERVKSSGFSRKALSNGFLWEEHHKGRYKSSPSFPLSVFVTAGHRLREERAPSSVCTWRDGMVRKTRVVAYV